MRNKSVAHSTGRRWLAGVMGMILACLLLFLAWQSVSTEQYVLYQDNLARYEQEAANCLAMSDSTYGSNYAYLASQWQELADDAHHYLAQHRSGAFCLCAASVILLAGTAWCFWPRKKTEESAPTMTTGPLEKAGTGTSPVQMEKN